MDEESNSNLFSLLVENHNGLRIIETRDIKTTDHPMIIEIPNPDLYFDGITGSLITATIDENDTTKIYLSVSISVSLTSGDKYSLFYFLEVTDYTTITNNLINLDSTLNVSKCLA